MINRNKEEMEETITEINEQISSKQENIEITKLEMEEIDLETKQNVSERIKLESSLRGRQGT